MCSSKLSKENCGRSEEDGVIRRCGQTNIVDRRIRQNEG